MITTLLRQLIITFVFAAAMAAPATSGSVSVTEGSSEQEFFDLGRTSEWLYNNRPTDKRPIEMLVGQGDFVTSPSVDQIWIVVHGFNTSRANARSLGIEVGRSIALAAEGKATTAVITFLWDGDEAFGLAERNADAAALPLSRLIVDVLDAKPDAKVAIVAHSLGARVALGALNFIDEDRSVELLALVQGAVRSTSIRKWHAVEILGESVHGIRSVPVENCSGRFSDGIGKAHMVVNTFAADDWVLRRAFGFDDSLSPHDGVCFLPALSDRAGLFSRGDAIRSNALGLPFPGLRENIYEYIPFPEFTVEGEPDSSRSSFDLPVADPLAPELLYKFTFEIPHLNFQFVDLQMLLREKPENGWHIPLRENSGVTLIEFLFESLTAEK